MKGDPIPASDHVVHYCSFTQLDDEGNPSGVAFRLKVRDGTLEDYLSVDWLEYFEEEPQTAKIEALRNVLRNFLNLGAQAKLAVLKVETLIKTVSEQIPGRALTVQHEPLPQRECHSGIYGLGEDDDVVADLIASLVAETHPAR